MSNNFRSDPQILDAVNFVFRAVMSRRVGDLPYGDDEALFPPEGKQTALAEPAVELHVIHMDMKNTEDSRVPDKKDIEARFVASRIQELVQTGAPVFDGSETRPVRYGDIVVLLRTPSSSGGAYVRALRQAGIPTVSTRGSSLFDTPEVTTLVSLLQVIDNPRRDIPLTAVLLSPLAGFTYEDLAEVRLLKQKADYWEALQLAAQEPVQAQEKAQKAVFLPGRLDSADCAVQKGGRSAGDPGGPCEKYAGRFSVVNPTLSGFRACEAEAGSSPTCAGSASI